MNDFQKQTGLGVLLFFWMPIAGLISEILRPRYGVLFYFFVYVVGIVLACVPMMVALLLKKIKKEKQID